MFFSKAKIRTYSMTEAAAELERDSAIQLIDVRTPEEYAAGHIPHSMNVPLQTAEQIQTVVPDHAARIFVYCLSGSRSRSACDIFSELGYSNVTNIGGIAAWTGKVERG